MNNDSFAKLTAELHQTEIRRILVCQLRQIGDVLLLTPSIELLARRFPQAEIHVFTEKKCASMLEGNPFVHTVWELDKKSLPTLIHELAFYRKVASQNFDLVVDFQKLPRIRWVVAFSKAPFRITDTPPWYFRWLYTHWTSSTPEYAAAMKAQRLSPLDIAWNGERPRLYLSPTEKADAQQILADLGLGGLFPDGPKPALRLITIDATHRAKTRQWPAEHYAALIDLLYEAAPDLRFLLPYGPGEESDVERIRTYCTHKNAVIIPQTLLSLRQMAACMSYASLHIGNCSAPRHMAVALDVPTLTILGSTSSGWTFPSPEHIHIQAKEFMDMPCQPCNKNTCPLDYRCLKAITPEQVCQRALSYLAISGRNT